MKKFRHECKFIFSRVDAELIRTAVAAMCPADSHVDDDGGYKVRSIYFDSFDDTYLHENFAGVNVRHKYRIRTYNNDCSHIKLERKETEMGLKHKASCILSMQECSALMGGDFFCEAGDNRQVLEELRAEHLLRNLIPKVIVEYYRIPYVYPMGNVRITFDYDISCSPFVNRFHEEDILSDRCLSDDFVVMEVKYDEFLPVAIRKIINKYSKFEQTAFSKYVVSRSKMGDA